MGRTKRDSLKRTMAQAYNHLDKALENLSSLKDQFEPHHPEDAELLEHVMVGILIMQKYIKDIWAKFWGSCPDDISVWL